MGAVEPLSTGELRCGGRCFRDSSCKRPATAQACCPTGQACAFTSLNSWTCRAVPAHATSRNPTQATVCSNMAKPNWGVPAVFKTTMDDVISDADYSAALALANSDRPHRTMKFGRRKGHWVINGETWKSFRVAAADIGQNTWEVWKLETGGGWFHPIHIHLVDFWVIRREGDINAVEPYEVKSPKDVVSLHPSATVYIMARWGAHKGDYMFHCHNLRHEDVEMMRSFTVGNVPGSKTAATAVSSVADFRLINTATNVVYDDYKLKDAMSVAATLNPKPLSDKAYLQGLLDQNIYRIFYPDASNPAVLQSKATNPWKVERYNTQTACPA